MKSSRRAVDCDICLFWLVLTTNFNPTTYYYNTLTLSVKRNGVSNHQPRDCLLNCLFRRRSKKTSKLRVPGLLWGIHWWPLNSPHKGPVTWFFPVWWRHHDPMKQLHICYGLCANGIHTSRFELGKQPTVPVVWLLLKWYTPLQNTVLLLPKNNTKITQ